MSYDNGEDRQYLETTIRNSRLGKIDYKMTKTKNVIFDPIKFVQQTERFKDKCMENILIFIAESFKMYISHHLTMKTDDGRNIEFKYDILERNLLDLDDKNMVLFSDMDEYLSSTIEDLSPTVNSLIKINAFSPNPLDDRSAFLFALSIVKTYSDINIIPIFNNSIEVTETIIENVTFAVAFFNILINNMTAFTKPIIYTALEEESK